MKMQTLGNELLISATNLPEFENLIEKAKREAEQLNKTLDQLSCFDFTIHFSVQKSSDQLGDIEAASSAIKTMPIK